MCIKRLVTQNAKDITNFGIFKEVSELFFLLGPNTFSKFSRKKLLYYFFFMNSARHLSALWKIDGMEHEELHCKLSEARVLSKVGREWNSEILS